MLILTIIKNPLFRYAAIGITVFFLVKDNLAQRRENRRKDANYDVLIGEKEASEQALILSKEELKKAISNDHQLQKAIDSLNIKASQVQSMNKTSSTTKIKFKTLLKDSIVYHDSTRINEVTVLKTFEFKDYWNNVKGVINKDTINLDIQSRDTLVLTEYTYKKGSWFLPKLFSKKHTKTDITNSNPNSSYHIEKRIEKKRH